MKDRAGRADGGEATWTAQRAIVLQLLRDDRDPRWGLAELAAELADIEPDALARALVELQREGVLLREDRDVRAAAAVRRLDALALIAI